MGQVNDAAKRRLNDNDSKFDAQLAQKIFMLQPLLKFYGQDMETTHKSTNEKRILLLLIMDS